MIVGHPQIKHLCVHIYVYLIARDIELLIIHVDKCHKYV